MCIRDRPTASIASVQDSINLKTMENEKLVVNGRHDPCIVPRAVAVVEAAVSYTHLDVYKRQAEYTHISWLHICKLEHDT